MAPCCAGSHAPWLFPSIVPQGGRIWPLDPDFGMMFLLTLLYCPVHTWLVRGWFPSDLEGRLGPLLCPHLPPPGSPFALRRRHSSWISSAATRCSRGSGSGAHPAAAPLAASAPYGRGTALTPPEPVVLQETPPMPSPVTPRYSLGNGQECQLHVHARLGASLHERHPILLQGQHGPVTQRPKRPSCPCCLADAWGQGAIPSVPCPRFYVPHCLC